MGRADILRNVTLLGVCQALFYMANTIAISTSPLVGLQYAPSPTLATLPLGAQFLGTMLTTVPASYLMKWLGRRGGLLIGAAFAVAAGLLSAQAIRAGSFLFFVLGGFLYGMFSAFAQYYRFAAADAADAGVAEGAAARRARAIAWVMAGGLVAAVIGPELAKATRELLPPFLFAGSYLAIAALGVASLVTLSFLRMPRPSLAERRRGGRPLVEILRTPGALTAVLAAVVAYVTMNLLMTATPLAMAGCGHDFSDTARVIQWHVVGMFAPSFVSGHLIARFGAPRVILAGVLAMLLTVAVAETGLEVEHFATALFLLGLGWNFMFVGGTSLLTSCHRPEEKAKVQGFNDLVLFTSVTLSASSSGALENLLGWQTMNLLALPGLLLVATVTLAAMRRREVPAAEYGAGR